MRNANSRGAHDLSAIGMPRRWGATYGLGLKQPIPTPPVVVWGTHPREYHLGGPNSTLNSFGVKKKRKKAAKPNLVFVEEREK